MFTLYYNQTGDKRLPFAKAVAEIIGVKPKYTGVPKCAYIIDFATITRQGNIEVDERVDLVRVDRLIQRLGEKGYPDPTLPPDHGQPAAEQPTASTPPAAEQTLPADHDQPAAPIQPTASTPPAAASTPLADSTQPTESPVLQFEYAQSNPRDEQPADSTQPTGDTIWPVDHAQGYARSETDVEQHANSSTPSVPHQPETAFDAATEEVEVPATTISVPRGVFTDLGLANLQKLLWAKGELIRQSLNITTTEIEVTDETVTFPWFGELDADEVKYISQFISGLCEFANTSQRITSKQRREGNPKFTMRTWLVRMGFNGNDFKGLRSYMMKRLPGDAAWRYGKPEREEAVTVAVSIPIVTAG